MNYKNAGRIVETKDGKQGRTYNHKGIVNGKVPVYLVTEIGKMDDGFEYPNAYSSTAILCDPKTLKVIGFID